MTYVKVIHSILTTLLAMLVLVSSTSFSVNMHVCGGHVSSVAIIENAAPCAMEQMYACHGIVHSEKKSNGCCEDKSLTFEGKDFSSNVEHVSPEVQNASWIAELPYLISVVPSVSVKAHSSFTLYKPPMLSHDISVLVHSFQI
ncbi:MAG TPA: hypothetical protein PKU83_06565 [Chryseolinea sp.]|nr:hypothetical protein [Chryseolinea sp.]